MGKIIELPLHISNQIKAGEIVERPVSVVKELVENAIDAKSTQIDVIVEEGGLSRIQVVDNGSGIASEDVLTAFKRHATSKMTDLIEKEAVLSFDRMPISTLGFRGEALPSIAAVSKVTLDTTTLDGKGTHVVIEGGQVVEHHTANGRMGTSITVCDLFYNTPARLKFISSLQTEVTKIADLMNRLALSHPEIAFSLVVDGNRLLKTSGNNQLKQTIAGVYSPEIAKKMIPLQASNLRFTVTGFACLPEITRARKHFISIFLNGRYIRNFMLINAVVDGYGTTLMVGRFPIAVIKIEADFELVDVNAHPAKETVRISQEAELIELIKQAVSQAMLQEVRIPNSLPKRFEKDLPTEQLSFNDYVLGDGTVNENNSAKTQSINALDLEIDALAINALETAPKSTDILSHIKTDTVDRLSVDTFSVDTLSSIAYEKNVPNRQTMIKESETVLNESKLDDNFDVPSLTHDGKTIKQSVLPVFDYFGQMHGTYLFAQSEQGLYIIDQHAAQERIKYEHYRVAIGDMGQNLQTLLVPLVLEYPVNDYMAIQEHLDTLRVIGINLEVFGQNSYILEAHPTWITQNVEHIVRELIDMVLENGNVSIAKYRKDVAIMMSCKQSIKANHYLDDYQARELLKDLLACENPYNCPHGRPVIVHLTNRDMEKLFKRIV